MSSAKRWRDTNHLQRAVDNAGGQQAFDTEVSEMLDQVRGRRLAELRERREPNPEQVPNRARPSRPSAADNPKSPQ
jgi:hypothetical protein